MKRNLFFKTLWISALMVNAANAVVPNRIPVQGVITDDAGDAVHDENATLVFGIYESKESTVALWKETQVGISINNGFFTVYLGDVTPIDPAVLAESETLWLEMAVGAEVVGRVRFGSVPFALEAHRSEQVGDLAQADIQPILGEACKPGEFLMGWDEENSTPICGEDQFAEVGDAGVEGVLQVDEGWGIDVDSVSDPHRPVVAVDAAQVQRRLSTICQGESYVQSVDPGTGSVICSVPPDRDTNAATECDGANVYLNGDGACVTVDPVDLSDYATTTWVDETFQPVLDVSCQFGIAAINGLEVTCAEDPDTNTNAATLCAAGEVLLGGGDGCTERRMFEQPLIGSEQQVEPLEVSQLATGADQRAISVWSSTTGVVIRQSSTLGGNTSYFEPDYPTLKLQRNSSSRGVNIALGNNSGLQYIYGRQNEFAIYGADKAVWAHWTDSAKTLEISGGIRPDKRTTNPCGTYPEGALFYNDTENVMCFCSADGQALEVSDNSVCPFGKHP